MFYSLIFVIFSAEKNKDFTNEIKSDFNLEDLNFDPAAIIGEGAGDWSVSTIVIIHKQKCISPENEKLFFISK